MKLLEKLKRGKEAELKSKRITNATIDEHREIILAKGRKFKYPFQYAKYKLVINTIIIGVVALACLIGLGWLELYRFQNGSDIAYRFTRVLPLPVAQVDDENVRYSDFLMIYRSSIAVIENQQGKLGDSNEDKLLKDQYKRQALDAAIEYSYALKLARELEIETTKEQIREAEKEHRIVDGVERGEESFANIIGNNFGLSVKEYERLLSLSLTRKQVAVAVDDEAKRVVKEIQAMLEADDDFEKVAESLGDAVIFENTGGLVDNLNLDGGRAVVASGLELGEISKSFVSKSGDAYYFVKVLEKNATQVSYESLKVSLRKFTEQLDKVKEEGRVKEYIELGTKGE